MSNDNFVPHTQIAAELGWRASRVLAAVDYICTRIPGEYVRSYFKRKNAWKDGNRIRIVMIHKDARPLVLLAGKKKAEIMWYMDIAGQSQPRLPRE